MAAEFLAEVGPFYTTNKGLPFTPGMSQTTLKIVFSSDEWQVTSSADIEEPLDAALITAGVGEITSGGVGPEGVFFNVEVDDPATALPFLQRELQRLEVPNGTRIEGLGGTCGVYEAS